MLHTAAGQYIFFVLNVIVYLYIAYCIRELARKQALPRPWLAWIPLANIYLLCRIVGKGVGWTILLLIPILDVIFIVLVALKLARRCHRNRWYGLLLLVPIVDLVVLWDLSFGIRHTWEATAWPG
jgi:hypothetical protein